MTTTPPDPQDKPPREFWLCKGDPIDPLQCPDLHVYAKKPLWKFADDAIRVIEYSAYEAMREANEFLRADILKTVAMFQESEKDKWTARKENAELKEKLARAERIIKKFSVYGTTDCENNNNGYMSRECSGRVTLFIANTKCTGCDPQSYRDDALGKKGDGG